MKRAGTRRRQARTANWVAERTWAIAPEAFAALAAGEARGPGRVGQRTGAGGPGAVAVVTIQGPMVARVSDYTRWYGLVSYEEISATLAQLMHREDVAGIVLDLNTPGGEVSGMPELAEQLHAWGLVKPIVALANPLAASAGLWLGSAATRFLVTPSGQVGSHGVLNMHVDVSAAMERYGWKVSMIASSKEKIERYPYQPLSDEARARMQAEVNGLFADFTNALARYRGVTREAVREGWGQGRMLRSADAVRVGMVDGVRTLDRTLAELASVVGADGGVALSLAMPAALEVEAESGRTQVHSQGEEPMYLVSGRVRQILERRGYVAAGANDNDLRGQLRTMAVARQLPVPTTADEADRLVSALFADEPGGGADGVTAPPALGGLSVGLVATAGLPASPGGTAVPAAAPPPAPAVPAAAVPTAPGTSGPAAEGVPAPPPAAVAGAPAAVPVPIPAAGPVAIPVATPAAPAPAVPQPGRAPATAPAGVDFATIVATVQLAGLPSDQRMTLQDQLLAAPPADYGTLVQRVNQAAQQYRQPAGMGPAVGSVRVTADERETFQDQAVMQLIARASLDGPPREIYRQRTGAMVPFRADPQVRWMGRLPHLMGRCAVLAGLSQNVVANLQSADYVSLLAGQPIMGVSAEQAANVRSMYGSILYDAANVQARRGYSEIETTYNLWATHAEPFQDFDDRVSTILGELPDPQVLPENKEFEDVITVDARESWRIHVWAEKFSLSWQLQVGDKLGQFLSIPFKAGRAFARKKEQLVYNHLKANPTLQADSTALFASRTDKVNTRGSVGSVTPANLEVMEQAFLLMKGLNDEASATLGLSPRWLLLPPARFKEAWTVLNSVTDPTASQNNPNIPNYFQGWVTPLRVPELSTANGGADTTWYGVADRGDVEGMHYAGLAGAEDVQVMQNQFVNSLGMSYAMWTTFGCKAVDFRAFQRMTG